MYQFDHLFAVAVLHYFFQVFYLYLDCIYILDIADIS